MQESDQSAPLAKPGQPEEKTHLWVLAVVTYGLVIVFLLMSYWAYNYVSEKAHREQPGARPAGEELRPHR